MHVPTEIKVRVDNEIKRCMALATQRFGREFQFPHMDYTLRGTTAGTANSGTYTIKLNSVLLMENVEDFLKRTVAHEFAHLVDAIVHPETRQTRVVGYTTITGRFRARRTKRTVHGPTWRSIMRLFGAPETRCHQYDTTNVKVKKRGGAQHVYTCRTCRKEMTLGPKRHHKMLAGATRYWNYGCGNHAGYDYVGLKGQERKVVVPPTPTQPATPVRTTVAGTTKLDSAIAVVRQYPNMPRKDLIALIGLTCGMSQAGAQTYYYAAKNKIG